MIPCYFTLAELEYIEDACMLYASSVGENYKTYKAILANVGGKIDKESNERIRQKCREKE